MDAKCQQIISDVERTHVLDAGQYTYLLGHIEHVGFENAFFYMMYCIDWQYMYEYTGRLTMFDIMVTCPTADFVSAYTGLKAFVVNGDTNNLLDAYNNIKSCIKHGLTNKGIVDTGKRNKKGLGEFINHFFMKVANVDYEFHDYTTPNLTGNSLSNRIVQDFLYKFTCAYQLMHDFRPQLTDKQMGQYHISYDKYLISHILLRHYSQTKIYYKYQPNPLYHREIKNGLNANTKITAIKGFKPLSSDGVFAFIDTFNRFLSEDKIDVMRDEVQQILCKLEAILQITTSQVNPANDGPVIIFYQGELYGVEFKNDSSSPNTLLIGSFYPLNSEWQNKFGISHNAFNKIINPDEMRKAHFSPKIECPFLTRLQIIYWGCISFFKQIKFNMSHTR